MTAMATIPWPLAVIDFETSSLEDDNYPIEVGIAIWRALDQPILRWSSLIRPEREWRLHGHWSRKSQKVHGIGPDQLSSAPDLRAVAEGLIARLDGVSTVLCDGGPYDAYWNGQLFAAAGLACPFRLGDWHRMLTGLPANIREAVLGEMERTEQRHRAAEDAVTLLVALASALGQRPDVLSGKAAVEVHVDGLRETNERRTDESE